MVQKYVILILGGNSQIVVLTLHSIITMKCYYQNLYNKETEQYEQFQANHQYNLYTTSFIRCGKCFNCRKWNAIQWVNKAKLEMENWKYAYFITLTYREAPHGLQVKDYQLFIKRFRKWLWSKHKQRLVYLLAGEYGTKFARPHYHGIFFMNVNIMDTFFKVAKRQYSSTLIEKLWGHGFITIAPASVETIAYTAFYSTKKLTKQERFSFIEKSKNGEMIKPEFIVASNGFGQRKIKDNLDYYLLNWKTLPVSFFKTKLFPDWWKMEVKEIKQNYIYETFKQVDWKKQRFEYFKKEKIQKDSLINKRKMEFK